jgi:multisubunit Na+/H+ antiporter MnhF subunit
MAKGPAAAQRLVAADVTRTAIITVVAVLIVLLATAGWTADAIRACRRMLSPARRARA